jgi:plasmid stabilization system protein ParE
MPLRLSFSSQAEAEFYEIVEYIARASGDWTRAELVGEQILKRCESAVVAPGSGSLYRKFEGVRKLNEGPYKLFYRADAEGVMILSIWDGRRGSDPKL